MPSLEEIKQKFLKSTCCRYPVQTELLKTVDVEYYKCMRCLQPCNVTFK